MTRRAGDGSGETHRTRDEAADGGGKRDTTTEETAGSNEVKLRGGPPSAREERHGPDGPDNSVYSSRRRRSGSRLRSAAILCFVIGCAIVAFTLLNLYVPATANPVHLSVDPLISLSALGTAGSALALFSLLVYAYAHRAGI